MTFLYHTFILIHPCIKYCCGSAVIKVFQLDPTYECCLPPGPKFIKLYCELCLLNHFSPLHHFLYDVVFILLDFYCFYCVFYMFFMFRLSGLGSL